MIFSRSTYRNALPLAMLILWSAPSMLTAAIGQQDSVGIQFFESKVRTILVEHCYQCHSAGSKPVLGGFKLDTKAGLLAGGGHGPAIVPGKPEKSRLVTA